MRYQSRSRESHAKKYDIFFSKMFILENGPFFYENVQFWPISETRDFWVIANFYSWSSTDDSDFKCLRPENFR